MKRRMPLEDFFTLAEIKDGLATLARVEELVCVMKERENIIKNAGDAARQWSTVANVLVATENKVCLDHFIELDGLPFLAQWLQKAHKCTADTNDNILEESINALLVALEKLPIDAEQSTASGLEMTLKDLLGHHSTEVKERARALFSRWNRVSDENKNDQDLDGAGCFINYDPISSPTTKFVRDGSNSTFMNVSSSKGSAQGHIREASDSENQYSNTAQKKDVSQSSIVGDATVHTSDHLIPLSNHADINGFPLNLHSFESKESSPCLADADGKLSCTKEMKNASFGSEEKNSIEGSLSDTSAKERHNNIESDPLRMNTLSSDLGSASDIPMSKSKNTGSECGVLTSSAHGSSEDGDQFHAELMQDHSNDVSASKMEDNAENSLHGKKPLEAGDGATDLAIESNSEASEGLNASDHQDILNTMLDTNDLSKMGKSSDMDFDYGVDDALEVAWQVAKEVEREVVDYRGPFFSSPDKNSEGEVMLSDSSKTSEVERNEPMSDKSNELEVKLPNKNPLFIDVPPPSSMLDKAEKITIKPEIQKADAESPSSTSVAEELFTENEKGKCNFDLNEEIYTDEDACMVRQVVSQPYTLPAPIPVVAFSKGNVALPSTRPHFEGEVGWKGRASSTSAFRPASPRRTQEHVDDMSSGQASSNGSKQKQSFLKIDLNVSGNENEAAADVASTTCLPISCGFHSRESSIEAGSRKTERLNLDLNRLGDGYDDGVFPSSDGRVHGQFNPSSGHHSQSTASSSSSSRKPSMVDFDLNDNPLVHDVHNPYDHWQNYNKSSLKEVRDHRNVKVDDNELPIVGSRVDANRKEFYSQQYTFLANGQSTPYGYNMARLGDPSGVQPTLAYAQPPPPSAFGYNDLHGGPSISFQHMYRHTNPVPYMVDSSGATVVPQLLNMATPIPTSSFSRPIFMGGPTTGPAGLPPFGVPGTGLDLNMMDGENMEVGKLRQFLVHGHGNAPVDESMRSLQQPGGMGFPLKRKEPDCGWEMSKVGYKQETSWH